MTGSDVVVEPGGAKPAGAEAADVAADLDQAAEVFTSVRPRLFGIAYRMLGSVADAEDLVQEVWLRWQTTDRRAVVNPAAFLATATTRLAINELQSARVRRETYVGPWLPEPVDTSSDPYLGAERGEAVVSGSQEEPGRIGASTVARLVERMARLRQMDILGGADTYRMFLGELESSQHLARTATYGEVTGRALASLIAEQAQQAGWSAFDAGWQDQARGLYELSRDAAEEARDEALTGNALAFLAYGAKTDAVESASAAVEHAMPDVPSTVRALLLERLAWAHAVAGNPRDVERSLEAAHEALTRDGERPSPDWAAWVDATELQIMTGRCWAQLRQPRRAIPVLERVLSEYPDAYGRDKALYLTWLADAYRDAGEVEQAAMTLGKAHGLSSAVASVRPRQRIAEVAATLAPYGYAPATVAEIHSP